MTSTVRTGSKGTTPFPTSPPRDVRPELHRTGYLASDTEELGGGEDRLANTVTLTAATGPSAGR